MSMKKNIAPAQKRKDKAVITDEVWTEDRIKLFLDVEPVEGVNSDFHRLLKAYQSMRSDDFAKFINFFKDAGGDINATNPEQQTLAEVISEHKQSQPYVDLLK